MPPEKLLGLQPVASDCSLGTWNAKFRAETPRKTPVAFNHHCFARRAEDRNFGTLQFVRPRGLRPVNGHWQNDSNLFTFNERAGVGERFAGENGSGQRGRVMPVIPG